MQHISVLKSANLDTLFILNTFNINSKSQKKIQEIKKILDLDLINNSQ